MGAIVQIDPDKIIPSALHRISREIVRGGVVLFPTETIYGLGCDSTNEKAVERIFAIKKRPETKPMIVLVRNMTMLRELVGVIPQLATSLIERYWPGPLTMLFDAARNVSHALTSGTRKIGVRMPGSTFCLNLLEESGKPIVSTSANISGGSISTDIASMKDIFLDKVDLFVDAGPLPHSLSSTIVDVSGTRLVLVREGAIPWNEIESFEKKITGD